MLSNPEIVLDNPAWAALTSQHAVFAQGTDSAKRYRPGIVSFVACRDVTEGGMEGLNPWMSSGESFYIIGDLPKLPPDWRVEHDLPCAQMLFPASQAGLLHSTLQQPAAAIALLGDADANDMFELISSVQPGYYHIDTRLLGNYYGIRQNGRLVAMAGERMRTDGFSELSAICSHPDYTGRGYAQQLITQLCRVHAEAGIISFLHVALSNQRAIRLYEHIGFAHRRSIHFRRLKKA